MEKYKYQQLAAAIRDAIDADEYPLGKPLPGERELAQKHACSRQTVRKAIQVLCAEGVLKNQHGSGNYALQKTRRPKSGLVGVLATHIALPHFATTLLSIEKTLVDGGYYPILATTGNRFDAEHRALQDLLQKNVDGLVVEGVLSSIPNPNIQLYKQLVAGGASIVFINTHYKEIEQAAFLCMDNAQGGALCGRYLLMQGHRKFAGVFKADDQESMRRYSGFARYLSEQGRPLDDNRLLWYTSANIQKPLEEFARTALQGCTAVVCFNDEIAFMLYQALRQNGIALPDNFEFIAFDKTEFSERLPCKITTLKYPQENIGRLAATKVMHMIEGKPEGSTRLQWQLFDTLGSPLHL